MWRGRLNKIAQRVGIVSSVPENTHDAENDKSIRSVHDRCMQKHQIVRGETVDDAVEKIICCADNDCDGTECYGEIGFV